MNIMVLTSMIGGVLLLDLVLSGDNALVIGVAAAGLARHQRWYALAIGGVMAMVLRILFTALASLLLNIPWLQTVGAIVLLYLAQKLLRDRSRSGVTSTEVSPEVLTQTSIPKRFTLFNNAFVSAMLTILIADVTMSFDNILAVGALANGEILPLLVGLAGSIFLLLLGSVVVSLLVERLGWLLDVAALILAWTSATMIHDDLITLAIDKHVAWLLLLDQHRLPLHLSWLMILLVGTAWSCILFFNLFYRFRRHRYD